MNLPKIQALREQFEAAANAVEGVECWMARDLQTLLGYTSWQNFAKVLEKAQTACQNAGESVADHFNEVIKLIALPKGAQREVADVALTRYACYLIAQNGDPRKKEIAFAQSYFALQTRKLELIEERIRIWERVQAYQELKESQRLLAETAYHRGVGEKDFGDILDLGDEALFQMPIGELKQRLDIPENRSLDDFAPNITLAAKNLATQMSHFNIHQKGLEGTEQIGAEHAENNQHIRHTLLKAGIQPENIPAETDIRKAKKKLKGKKGN